MINQSSRATHSPNIPSHHPHPHPNNPNIWHLREQQQNQAMIVQHPAPKSPMAYQLGTVEGGQWLPTPSPVFWGLQHGKSYQSLANKNHTLLQPLLLSCFLTSSACCPVVVVEQQQGPNQDPKYQHLTVQITDYSFLFWLKKGRLNGAWMLFFHYSVCIPNWSNPTLSLQHLKNKSPTFLPSFFTHFSSPKIKWWSELSDSFWLSAHL